LHAREYHRRDREYVVQNGQVVIVDEFTGRLMPQRTWRDGLHQAIEAREGLPPSSPSETLARMSFQRFFRLIPRLSGMTGTAWEARGEFWQIYNLAVVRIPTQRPVRRQVLPDRAFSTAAEKWQAVVEEVARLHATGRPVLVGTRSVATSEHLSILLKTRHLPHRLLNANRHSEEAVIVGEAGEPEAISIATNMAGRGTDIRISERVAELGGLAVIATERHESGRIDRQLFGRCARQGDPGTAQAFISWEDEVVMRFLPGWVRRAMQHGTGTFGERSLRQAVHLAQVMAQRQAFNQRKAVLRSDQWIEDSLGFTGASVG
jgi:preprotein translocase subunit SecA